MVVLKRSSLSGNHSLNRLLFISFLYFSGMLSVYAQQRYNRFDHLTTDNGLSSNRIWCLLRDSKDFLWMSTDVGLDKYNGSEIKRYRNDEKQPGTISNDNILCIYEDKRKNLWFGTINGLNLYDPDKTTLRFLNTTPLTRKVLIAITSSAFLKTNMGPFGF